MKSNEVGIIGAGYMAIDTASYLLKKGMKVSYFADEIKGEKEIMGIPHIKIEDISNGDNVISAIGPPELKMKLIKKAKKKKVKFINCINADLDKNTKLGHDITVAPGCFLTKNIKLGSHIIINTGSIISHNVEIADSTYVSPGVNIAGLVKIGKGVYIGIGATLIDRITIGDNVFIGAGAVVTKDVAPGDKVAGVPARSIK